MRLFIAEKPSLGQAIADGLGSGKRCGGYIDCGDDIVTWCFGHLFELCNPEDYDPSWSSWSVVPVVPSSWRVKPKDSSADQVEVTGGLLRRADLVVNAGDPDREGQLLVDEVLEHFGYQGTVERIWLASLDARSVARALAGLADNGKYMPLRDAARARSQADWLIGMNATRALTNMGVEVMGVDKNPARLHDSSRAFCASRRRIFGKIHPRRTSGRAGRARASDGSGCR